MSSPTSFTIGPKPLASRVSEMMENALTENAVLQDDLRDMLRALGLPDHARPQSPREAERVG
jgi:hypothetical protein